MKTIEIEKIEAAVKQLCIQANYVLPKDVKQQICKMQSEEIWPYAHRILRDIKENIEIAEEKVFHYVRIQDRFVFLLKSVRMFE